MKTYDVFLCHNSRDKAAVREIYEVLCNQRGLSAFLDESALVGGQEWESHIGLALTGCKALAAMVGGHGWGAYQLEGELVPAMARMREEASFRVIPVLMPGFDERMLVQRRDVEQLFAKTQWVDLRDGFDDLRMTMLIAALRGENPFPEGRPELLVARVRFDAARWDVTRRDASLLYGGTLLQEAAALLARTGREATALTHEFIAAGHAHQNEMIGRRLASAASALLGDPSQTELAAALAVEATLRHATPEALDVLRSANTRIARTVTRVDLPSELTATGSDAGIVVFGCAKGHVVVCSSDAPRTLQPGHTDRVTAIAFDPESRWIATGSTDKTVRIWEANTGNMLRTFDVGEPVESLEARRGPKGTMLLAYTAPFPGTSGHVKLWKCGVDWDDSWRWAPGMAQGAALDARAERVILAWGSAVAAAATDTGERLPQWLDSNQAVRAIAAHPQHDVCALITADGTLSLAKLGPTGVTEMNTLASVSLTSIVRFSPGGRWLAACGTDHLYVWDMRNGGEPRRFPYQKLFAVDAIFNQNETLVAVLSGETGLLTVWDLAERAQIYATTLPRNTPAQFIGNRRIACATEPGVAKILELPRLDPARWTLNPMLGRDLAFSHDERWLRWVGMSSRSAVFAVKTAQGPDREFFVAEVATGEPISIELAHTYGGAGFDPTGSFVVLADGPNAVLLGMESAPDADVQADASWFDLDPDYQARKDRLLAHPAIVASPRASGYVDAFPSRSGRWLVLTHDRNVASLWNMERAAEVCRVAGNGKIHRAAFDRDETRVAFADENGGITIWSTTGIEQTRVRHGDAILDLAFSPRGTYLAASSVDGCVRLWAIDPRALVEQVRELTKRELSEADWNTYLPGVPR